MAVYGLVFAAPFVALSLFPRAMEKMPNSGSWMETLKIAFGFIEIAAAIKFLWVPDLEMEPWPVTKEYGPRAFYFYWITTNRLFIRIF